jgi:hypothetical protein
MQIWNGLVEYCGKQITKEDYVKEKIQRSWTSLSLQRRVKWNNLSDLLTTSRLCEHHAEIMKPLHDMIQTTRKD